VDTDLRTYRVLCLVAAFFLPLLGFIHQATNPQALDSLTQRFILSALCLVVFLLSLRLQKGLLIFAYAMFYGLTVWLIHRNFVNQFSVDYMVGLLMGVLAMSVGFQSPRHLAIYCVTTSLLTAVACVFVTDPQVGRILPISAVSILSVIAYIVLSSRLRTQAELAMSERTLREAHDTLESRVQERTAELIRANAALRAEITERQRVEKALRESERRYRDLFENANDAIGVISLDGTFTAVNRGVELLTHWSREEVVGQHHSKVVTPATVALLEECIRRALTEERQPSLYEVELVRKDGSVVPVEVRARLLRDNEGNPIGLQSIARDISARKELAQQWADFLAMLTHDIRNPLGAILGYVELLLEKVKEQGLGEDQDLLERLRSNTLTIHSLVTNYLDLSRIEAGQLTLAKQPLDLNELLLQVQQQYETEARRRFLTLDLQLQEGVLLVVGEVLALERVFANLLHNALKFTPERGQVTISSARRGNEVIATVTDTGPGIAPEEMPLLFEKYQRTRAAKYQEGTGLGLFIVKALIEAQGGRVEVQSALGQGSCFTVVLPAASPQP
jgi:PAS domain S-box-containing protein